MSRRKSNQTNNFPGQDTGISGRQPATAVVDRPGYLIAVFLVIASSRFAQHAIDMLARDPDQSKALSCQYYTSHRRSGAANLGHLRGQGRPRHAAAESAGPVFAVGVAGAAVALFGHR